MVERVRDSLSLRSDYFNAQVTGCFVTNVPLDKNNKDSVVLFLSPKCENIIYGEIIERGAIRYLNNKYDFWGMARCFIFVIGENKILKVYEGYIHYN